MFNHASGQLLPEHTWNPRCAQKFSWTHVQQDIGAAASRAHAKSEPLGSPSAHRVQRDACSCDKTAALACHRHTWIFLHAQTDMFWCKDCCDLTPRAHLDLFPCANRHVHATTLLHSHAVSTLGSLSVRKQTCSGAKTAAFSRREHTWISLRA